MIFCFVFLARKNFPLAEEPFLCVIAGGEGFENVYCCPGGRGWVGGQKMDPFYDSKPMPSLSRERNFLTTLRGTNASTFRAFRLTPFASSAIIVSCVIHQQEKLFRYGTGAQNGGKRVTGEWSEMKLEEFSLTTTICPARSSDFIRCCESLKLDSRVEFL